MNMLQLAIYNVIVFEYESPIHDIHHTHRNPFKSVYILITFVD